MTTSRSTPQQPQRIRPLISEESDMGVDERLLDFIPDEPARGMQQREHLTKFGRVDRRFRGQRDVPPEETVINPSYVRPTQGGIDPELGMHVSSKTGMPDRRFKENRGRSNEEILSDWAQKVYSTYHKH